MVRTDTVPIILCIATHFHSFRYVKCDEMAKNAAAAVKNGELKIVPEHHIKIWYHWMENIR